MADIASNRVKLNDIEISANAPLTEALFNKMGANINDYLDKGLRYEEFLSNDTWTCPLDVYRVYVEAIGGGAGGGSGGVSGSGGGGGGSSGTIFRGWINVTPLTDYVITIGTGGAGGVSGGGSLGNAGGNGGQTSFGSLVIVDGGLAGVPQLIPTPGGPGGAVNGSYYGRGYRQKGGNGSTGFAVGDVGESNNIASGGAGGIPNTSNFYGGGGGGAGFDNGGDGGTNFVASQPGSRGSGGGGGLGTNSGVGQAGAAGGNGCVRLTWYGNS